MSRMSIPKSGGSTPFSVPSDAGESRPSEEMRPVQASITHPNRDEGPFEWKGTDRYEVLSCLGHGGMGVVYEVFDRERRRLVALKTIFRFSPGALYLFKQEFRTLADVQHANLVHLYELVVGELGDPFFTMELVRGTDFLHYVRRQDPPTGLDPPATTIHTKPATFEPGAVPARGADEPKRTSATAPESLVIANRLRAALRQLVQGVYALHLAGKLHRDIKPSNVLVTHEGRVVLLDFGVATELSDRARDTQVGSGEIVGTARYMAPEQAYDEPPTPASDWYSVGVMLYEALVGRAPFVGTATDVITRKGLMDAPLPSECVEGVPPEFDALCGALLHRDPAMRPDGAEILRRLGITGSGGLTSSRSAAFDSATALIGREETLRSLRDAFDATRSRRMITVRVGGAGGMGKSTVVHHLLDELVRGDDALVLRGRAYERETVPYKAIDSVVDALSRHLLQLAEADDALALPKDVAALGRLFPVLQRVPGIKEPIEQRDDDLQSLRRRAFDALRELLTGLAERQPLVVFVDDAQWGDVDSAVLFLDLLRSAKTVPLLLVMTYRDDEAASSPFLTELREHWPDGAEARDVTVGPLDAENARRLALTLLASSDTMAQRTARAVARESRGSPFLIEELVRTNRSVSLNTGATLAVITLEQMVGERLARLPDEARRLLEIVAVGGRPLPVSVVAEASGLQDSVYEVIAFVSGRRFVRMGSRNGHDVVETSHDRFRETIVAQLPRTTLRDHHARLARALEQAPGVDAEALAMHFLGAGDADRAVRFAEIAAEQAVAKLAFDQAARLFRLTLETFPASSVEGSRLRKRLGEVLEFAGRSAEAGRIYLEAVEGAPELQKLDLQRAAAEQLHASGLMDEGTQVLRGVLAAVGVWAPRSSLTALLWWIWQHLWLRAVGLRFRQRELRADDRLRLDTLIAVGLGFALVDHVLGIAMKARMLVVALRLGDRLHTARGAGLVALDVAGYVGAENATERRLRQLAQSLAEQEPNPLARYTVRLAAAITLHYRGCFKEAKAALDPIQAMSSSRRVGQQSALLFTLHSIQFLGDMTDLADRYTRALVDAEERGNLFMSVALRTSTAASVWLAADDPETARRELRKAMAQWAQKRFSSPEWRATLSEAEVDLYVGDGGAAYERVKGLLRRMTKNFFLVHHSRVMVAFIHGRAAIASLPGLPPKRRRMRLREARRLMRVVGDRQLLWTAPLVSILEAGVAQAMSRPDQVESALRAAAAGADAAHMALHAAAARHELGMMIGGEKGSALVHAAEEAMTTRGVRVPARFAPMLVPGVVTQNSCGNRMALE